MLKKGELVSFRPDIKVFDCTLRDGGLVNDFFFTDDFVKDLYLCNIKSGIDYMEFGYKADRDLFDEDSFGKWKFCHEQDIAFMVDEVQTGNGRSGQFYAYQTFGVLPDAVSTAKGLGGGLPIGAVMLGEKLQDVLGPGDHGSTFGGNPAVCAGAVNILERIDEDLLASVRKKSEYIFKELKGAEGIESVSGLGLMIGIKTVKPAAEVVKACMDKGVLCITAKDKVRLLPALNIPEELLAKAIGIIKEVCA